jgi:hypothetical protein
MIKLSTTRHGNTKLCYSQTVGKKNSNYTSQELAFQQTHGKFMIQFVSFANTASNVSDLAAGNLPVLRKHYNLGVEL